MNPNREIFYKNNYTTIPRSAHTLLWQDAKHSKQPYKYIYKKNKYIFSALYISLPE